MRLVRLFVVVLFVGSSIIAKSQYNRYLSFDLYYLMNQDKLTNTQKDKLNRYVNHVISCNVQGVFIDTSISRSKRITNTYRAHFLKAYLVYQGINSSLIHILGNENSKPRIIHNLSDGIDAIGVSISYASDNPIEKFRDTIQTGYEKILLEESGVKSSTTVTRKTCGDRKVIRFLNGYELSLNNCDYEKHIKSLVFNTFTSDEMSFFKKVPKLNDLSSILGAYHLKLRKGIFQFPALLKIPIEKCMEKSELSLFLCNDTSCSLIEMENIFDPVADYLIFRLEKPGEYYFIHSNTKKEYAISFRLPKKYTLSMLDLSTRCHDIHYRAIVKGNKISLNIPETYFEPYIDVIAYDKSGKYYQAINIPVSKLKGKKYLTDFMVFEDSDKSAREKKMTLYKKYIIGPSSLKFMVRTH